MRAVHPNWVRPSCHRSEEPHRSVRQGRCGQRPRSPGVRGLEPGGSLPPQAWPDFTQCLHGFLALLDLLGHHPADPHEVLCDGAGRLGQALFGSFPRSTVWKEECQQKPSSRKPRIQTRSHILIYQISIYFLNGHT